MPKRSALIQFLPRYGSIATGVIYILIGSIALLSLLKLRDGGADESSILAILNASIVGQVCIAFILVGLICFVLWRCYEAIRDPYHYGNTAWGIIKRVGVGISSITDLLIAYTAIRIWMGNGNVQVDGQPLEERELAATLLQNPNRAWIVLTIGIIYSVTSVIQFVYGVTRGYKDRMTMEKISSRLLITIHSLGIAGYTARGFILGIIGFFFMKAYYLKDENQIVNTDKAFDFIGDNVGHIWFTCIALGTICYGLFMIALGITYKNTAQKERV